MRHQTLAVTIALASIAAISPGLLTAQRKPQHVRYTVIDLGTFGGPNSQAQGGAQVLTNRRMAVGGADTTDGSQHAFDWKNGVLNDLGTLPNGKNSFAGWINDRGQVAGTSENGLIDPLTGEHENRGILWQDGRMIDLGTLGGSQTEPIAINNRGQVIGAALNNILDPYSIGALVGAVPAATQSRAFLWQDGVMQDLDTLGGPDAFAQCINDRGQVAGLSYTSSIPDPTTQFPPVHPFLWSNGKMQDLGTLGGAYGEADALNNRGQVAGIMTLAGEQATHAYRWDHGHLTDLGTLGGARAITTWMNEAGDVVGNSDLPGVAAHHAYIWSHGVMTDLGVPAGDECSTARYINSKRQVVGQSSAPCGGVGDGFISENGGPAVSLNSLLLPGSGLRVINALVINEAGEILARGRLANGDRHVILLVPVAGGESSGLADSDQPLSAAAPPDIAAPVQTVAGRERFLGFLRRVQHEN